MSNGSYADITTEWTDLGRSLLHRIPLRVQECPLIAMLLAQFARSHFHTMSNVSTDRTWLKLRVRVEYWLCLPGGLLLGSRPEKRDEHRFLGVLLWSGWRIQSFPRMHSCRLLYARVSNLGIMINDQILELPRPCHITNGRIEVISSLDVMICCS